MQPRVNGPPLGSVAGWLLYDGSCGVCSRGVRFGAPTLRRYGVAIAPLQSDWVRDQLDIPEGELLTDVRLLTADTRQIVGADVYRYIMRRIWWAYPFYVLTLIPGIRTLYEWGYRRFAKHRYHISRVCQIDVK